MRAVYKGDCGMMNYITMDKIHVRWSLSWGMNAGREPYPIRPRHSTKLMGRNLSIFNLQTWSGIGTE